MVHTSDGTTNKDNSAVKYTFPSLFPIMSTILVQPKPTVTPVRYAHACRSPVRLGTPYSHPYPSMILRKIFTPRRNSSLFVKNISLQPSSNERSGIKIIHILIRFRHDEGAFDEGVPEFLIPFILLVLMLLLFVLFLVVVDYCVFFGALGISLGL